MWRESRLAYSTAILACCLVLPALSGCGSDDAGTPQTPQADTSDDECGSDSDCDDGSLCVDGMCTPEGSAAEGDECRVTGECKEGLYCDPSAGDFNGRCKPAGEGEAGDTCGSTADCKPGLVCKPEGLSGVCTEAGDGNIGDECEDKTDCRAGLTCAAAESDDGTRTCSAGSVGRPKLFQGVPCDNKSEGSPRLFFEVPKNPAEVTEFYRLPFPNDARTKNGRPNLAGHPTPGKEPLGFDIVQTYVDQISSKQKGYGLQQTVYFRFSETIDFGTLGAGDNPTLRFVNITQGSDGYDQGVAFAWRYTSGRTKYICHDWLSVRVPIHRPLAPETTYAVILSKGVQTSDGDPIQADGDFEKMLADQKPSGALGDAWQSYQPLRDWVSDRDDVSSGDLIGAAVFTTGAPRQEVRKLRTPARDKSVAASDLTLCEEGVESPCDDGLEGDAHRRGCFGTNDKFHEIQGTLSLPVFQKGQAPYLNEGGGVEFKNGAGVVQKRDDVCMTMTVPKQVEMPANGWPLVLYAPGTGGTARDVVADLAGSFSELGDSGATGVMMMSWEQVQHFRRRGDSKANPERLVFNYANPDAAKGNFLQGAADIFAVVKWAEEFSREASNSPTGEKLLIDTDHIFFVGHSQGGTTGPLALPYEPNVEGTILSGAGGGLVHSLLGKTSPRDVTAGVALALHEPGVTQWHPVLSLLQGYFAPVDPVNYGKFLVKRQIEMETTPRHVFHLYGTGDTYTPPKAIEALARSLGVEYIEPVNFESGDFSSTTQTPVSENITTGGSDYTGVGRQYEPGDYDGHFVLFEHDKARDDAKEFLSTGLFQSAPKIQD